MRYPISEKIKWMNEKLNLDIREIEEDDFEDNLVAKGSRDVFISVEKAVI
jgi:hypothetical protein